MSDSNNSASRSGPTHANVFIWIFAVSTIWHYTSASNDILSYWFRFDPLVTPLVFLSIVTAFIAALYPNKTAAMLLFSGGNLAAICLRFPFVADHLVMEMFLNLSIVLAFGYVAFKRRTFDVSVDAVFELFAPIGRWLLIIMYFFGVFHKLNPGFMSIGSSCAIPFIQGLPLPDAFLAQSWLQYAAIYGTLIFESIAMLLLLSSRTKYLGMLLGMSFHFVIGISDYGTLAHFSAFALALHTLFLPSNFGRRIRGESFIAKLPSSEQWFKILTILLIALQILFAIHLATTRHAYLVNSLFTVFAFILMFLVIKHGQMRDGDRPYRLKSSWMPLHVIPIWFFLHCVSPYVGLGTGGVIGMFSGLRTEGGVSNHYLITKPLPLFSYQDKIVYVEEATNPSLKSAADGGQGIVLFDFQRHFSQREDLMLPLRVRIDTEVYAIDDRDSFMEFYDEHYQEQRWIERKYMSFRLVDGLLPDRCRH